jgi:hypothetical protein
MEKHPSAHYIGANGTANTEYDDIPLYTIIDGALTATIKSDTYHYGADYDVPHAPFVASLTPGCITTSVIASANGWD